jgi:hypothetical protein
LFSNIAEENIPVIDGFNIYSFFKENNIEFHHVRKKYSIPLDYYHKFQSQFFIFDILKYVVNGLQNARNSRFLILDSDCIFIKKADSVFSAIQNNDMVVYPINYKLDKKINGLTRTELGCIFEELGLNTISDPEYFGGEFFAAGYKTIRKIMEKFPVVLSIMLERKKNGQLKFNEEAHFLSYFYTLIGNFYSDKNSIKRIWTSPLSRPIRDSDLNLTIWHLPFEKKYGFEILFNQVIKNQINFRSISNNKLQLLINGIIGLPERRYYLNLFHRFLYSGAGKYFYKIKSKLI